MGQIGGARPGAGRPKGSKNKSTLAKEAVAEILDVEDAQMLEAAVHQRGHQMLIELERIVMDPTQPLGARIMAARVALPFMLPRKVTLQQEVDDGDRLIALIEQRRTQLSRMHSYEGNL